MRSLPETILEVLGQEPEGFSRSINFSYRNVFPFGLEVVLEDHSRTDGVPSLGAKQLVSVFELSRSFAPDEHVGHLLRLMAREAGEEHRARPV